MLEPTVLVYRVVARRPATVAVFAIGGVLGLAGGVGGGGPHRLHHWRVLQNAAFQNALRTAANLVGPGCFRGTKPPYHQLCV